MVPCRAGGRQRKTARSACGSRDRRGSSARGGGAGSRWRGRCGSRVGGARVSVAPTEQVESSREPLPSITDSHVKQPCKTTVRLLAARSARGVLERVPERKGADDLKRGRRRPSREGAGNAGCPLHPQSVCKGRKHTASPQVHRDTRHFPAQWV